MIAVNQTIINPPSTAKKVRQVWTPAEDQLLARSVQRETPETGSISWCNVAAHLPGRTNKDCRKRWHYSIAHGHNIRKGTWTREEDQRLQQAVQIHGTRWSKIAQVVGTRNGDQCWKRWYDCLDPQIDKSPWTPEEDAQLVIKVAELGRNWTGIVNEFFPKRTSLSAKNRYSILQRKQEVRDHSRQGITSRESRHMHTHVRNVSSEPGSGSGGRSASTTTTTTSTSTSTLSHQGYDGLMMLDMTPEPEHSSLFYPQQSSQQAMAGYCWSPAHTGGGGVPSGSSTPESAHTDMLVEWSTWDNSPAVSYHVDSDSSASYYLPMSNIHLPQSDHHNTMVDGGFYNSILG